MEVKVINEAVSEKDIKSLKVGDQIIHKNFDEPVTVIELRKESNPMYNKPYGFSCVVVKASDGNTYDLYINSETLRIQKRTGTEVKKWSKIIHK